MNFFDYLDSLHQYREARLDAIADSSASKSWKDMNAEGLRIAHELGLKIVGVEEMTQVQ